MVLAGHAGWGPRSIHGIGVEVFFVLSGFLITSLLVEEWSDAGRVSLRRFYLRRARRLLPALALVLIAVTALAWRGEISRDANSRGVLAGLGYATNWTRMVNDQLGVLEHLWSLAIEEHFYLAWPAIVVAILAVTRRLTGALVVAAALLAGSMAARLMLVGGDYQRIANGDDTRAATLLIGCIAAIVVHQRPMWEPRTGRAVTAGVAAAVVLWWASSAAWNSAGFLWLIVLPVAALAALVGVLLCCSTNPVATLLSNRRLVDLGKISYGAYLWHPLVYSLTGATVSARIGSTVVGVAATLGIAMLSYRYVESPIRRRGFREFIRRPRPHVEMGSHTPLRV